MKRILLSVLALAAALQPSAAQTAPRLGKAPLSRVVAAMTLEEKASLLVGVSDAAAHANIADGAGTTYAIPRLGIPSTVMQDGPAGVRMKPDVRGREGKYYCTGFPAATLLAASWNTDVVRRVGATMGSELRSYASDILLAPAMNIHRNPLCGRNFEYYSEDPLLAGMMAAAAVRGLQSTGGGATIKHFTANNQQTMRLSNDARMSQRTLREIYLRPFEIAIREQQPWAVMSSYNALNGTLTQHSRTLLTDILRGELGFRGLVVTDWWGVRGTVAQVHAGNDLLMGGAPQQVKDIIEGVRSGALSEADVDSAVSHVLEYILKTNSYRGVEADWAPDLKAHAQVSREAATEGIVLLKNERQALPLAPTDTVALFGVGTYLFYANGRGSGDVNKPYVVNLTDGLENARVRISSRLDRYYRSHMETENLQLEEYNQPTWSNWFFGFKKPMDPVLDEAFIRFRAKECSKAIITLARDAGEGADRDYTEGDYLLTPTERKLIADVSRIFHKQGKPVIVVLNTGGAMDVASWDKQADAILLAWQPGEEGGNAVADILTGHISPSGKLPLTLAADYHDIPSSKNFPLHYTFDWNDLTHPSPERQATRNLGYTEYEEGIWVGYRHFNTRHKPVAYPFGHGLSYTTFGYAKPTVRLKGGRCRVSVAVTNTGSVAGKEAVQLYTTAPQGGMEKPLRELRAFAKTPILQPGATATVEMEFPLTDLASFDEARMAWVADAGAYTLSVAASVEDVRQTATLRLAKPLIGRKMTKL